jgi:hypothetical protein
MNIDYQTIGEIHLGAEGWDQYIKLKAKGGEAPMWDDVHDWLLRRHYRDTKEEAGGYYCHQVTVMPRPRYPDEFVGIVHHRYDV